MAVTCGAIGEINSGPPSQPRWYATMHSWDAEEGMFPSAHYWTGNEWQPETSAGIIYWPIRFESESEARVYAEDHDLEA